MRRVPLKWQWGVIIGYADINDDGSVFEAVIADDAVATALGFSRATFDVGSWGHSMNDTQIDFAPGAIYRPDWLVETFAKAKEDLASLPESALPIWRRKKKE